MSSSDKELDLNHAKRGVWLVKVPKYISNLWEKSPKTMPSVGKLKIVQTPNGQKEIFFSLSDEVLNLKDPNDPTSIPKEHRFTISKITHQTLGVFSQPKSSGDPLMDLQNGNKLAMEGHVVQKGECRPIANENYMKMKRQKIIKASEPVRMAKHIDEIVQNYKPVSDHKHNIEFEARKKAEGKKSREDKEKVHEMLFAAFEKHQYYNIKDLERITRQPIPYLKEILKEICNYNAKNPHKNMWELKPEYRHYKTGGEEEKPS